MNNPYTTGSRDVNTGWTQDIANGYNPATRVEAHTHTWGDVVFNDMPAAGFVMLSANGSRWRITVDNAGALVVTAA